MRGVLQSLLQIQQWIKWKQIFILTICLMSIHFLFLGIGTYSQRDAAATPGIPVDLESGKQTPNIPHDPAGQLKDAEGEELPQYDSGLKEVEEEKEKGKGWPEAPPVPDDGLPNNEYVAI